MSSIPKFGYLLVFAFLSYLAVKVFINSNETTDPSERLKNIIKFLEDTETFETEV